MKMSFVSLKCHSSDEMCNLSESHLQSSNCMYNGKSAWQNNSNSYAEAIKEALLVNDDIDKASLEQVIAAICDVEDAIEELGYATVTEVNKDKVKEYIKEHPNE